MKMCATCGREIEPRKKWEKNWDQIKYCSDRCRKEKVRDTYEEEILKLLLQRGFGKTICPSEILLDEQKKDKMVMEKVRAAARRLVAQGKIVITQKGTIVDPSTARGPLRLKLVVNANKTQ